MDKDAKNNLIDGQYEIVKRFGDSMDLVKMVFIVRHLITKELEVLKVYTQREQEDFAAEVQRNMALSDSPKIVKMTKFVQPYESMPAFAYNGVMIDFYSYIIIPLCEKGTILDLLMKACATGTVLSMRLQGYLTR